MIQIRIENEFFWSSFCFRFCVCVCLVDESSILNTERRESWEKGERQKEIQLNENDWKVKKWKWKKNNVIFSSVRCVLSFLFSFQMWIEPDNKKIEENLKTEPNWHLIFPDQIKPNQTNQWYLVFFFSRFVFKAISIKGFFFVRFSYKFFPCLKKKN